MKVQDVMTRNVEACSPDTDLATAAMIMWRSDCGVVPVKDRNGKVAGMITDRDICMAVATQHRIADQIRVQEVIGGTVHSVQPSDDISVAAERMRTEQVRRLPVVTRDGKLAGVISVNDLILSAESPAGGRNRISTDEVMSVLRGVCGHRGAHDTSSMSV